MRRVLLAPSLLLILAGCYFGPRVGNFAPAHGPQGVSVEALTRQASFGGELLAVREDGLLLLILMPRAGGAGTRVVALPFGVIREAHFEKLGAACDMKDGQAPAVATRERLRRVSRFPQGLSEELLRLLLNEYGQAEIERIQE